MLGTPFSPDTINRELLEACEEQKSPPINSPLLKGNNINPKYYGILNRVFDYQRESALP